MEPVRSPRNRRVTRAAQLQRARIRRETGRTLLEGPVLVAEAVEAGATVEMVFGLPEDLQSQRLAVEAGAEWIPVTQAVLDRLAPTETPRGPVATLRIPEPAPPERDLLLLDVRDPGNAGTLVRSGAAFGFDVGAFADAVDLWSPKVLRAGAGAHFRTRLAQPIADIPEDMQVLGAVADGGIPLQELARRLRPEHRWALLVGSEAQGLSREHLDRVELLVTISMPGRLESLNAAVAGSIIAYQLSLHRCGNLPAPGEH